MIRPNLQRFIWYNLNRSDQPPPDISQNPSFSELHRPPPWYIHNSPKKPVSGPVWHKKNKKISEIERKEEKKKKWKKEKKKEK